MRRNFGRLQFLSERKGARVTAAVLLPILCVGLLSFGIRSLTQGNTLGSDFYVFYLAGKSIQNYENPYSGELEKQAQLSIYKRLARPGEDALGFAYPPYALLPVFPLLLLHFEEAQAIWMAVCILLMMTAVFVSGPRVPVWIILSILCLYPVSFGLILGNFAIPIAAILLIAYSLITGSKPLGVASQLAVGMLLAWITCKPQFSGLFVIALLLFSFQRRYSWVIHSFLFSASLFILLSFLLLPEWPALLADQLARYSRYNHTWLMVTFFAMQFFSANTSIRLTILAVILLFMASIWIFKIWKQEKINDLTLFSWVALIAFLIHPRGKSYEQIIYLIPMILWVAQHPSPRSWKVHLFWFGTLLFLAITSALSTVPGRPDSLIEWPLAVFIFWFGWFFLKSQGKIPGASRL